MPRYSVDEEIDMIGTPGLLTEREAEVFVLRDVKAVRRQEVASELGIAVSTVDNTLTRANRKIREAREALEAIDAVRHQM